MFWNKKTDPNPLGVPLGDLMALLEPTTIKASMNGSTLLARHEHYTIRIEVAPPEVADTEMGPIKAVVRMITDLPEPIETMFHAREAETAAALNSHAGLGGLYQEDRKVHIGSRLTIYEREAAWRTLHLPLLLFTTICGSEAILGGLRRTLTNEQPSGGKSRWTDDDVESVADYLSTRCICTTGGGGLTAEFGLAAEAISAATGDQKTALFQLMSDQPHPELGGGLFCLLQMPHRLPDEDRLAKVCLALNKMEMAADDLPPHFGAWCPGRLGNNPAYVTFLPNALHSTLGIAINVAIWARARAQWANAMLAALGGRV